MNLIFNKIECTLKLGKYSNNRLAMQLVSSITDTRRELIEGTPIITVSLNIPEYDLKKNQIIIKDYSENKGILELLINEGIIYEPFPLNIGYVNATIVKKSQTLMELENNLDIQINRKSKLKK